MLPNRAVPTYAQLWLDPCPPAESERLTPRQQDKLFGAGLLAVVAFSSPWWQALHPPVTVAGADVATLGMALTGFILGLKVMLELPRTTAAAMPGFGLLATVLMMRGEQMAVSATTHWWQVLGARLFGG